MTKVQSGSQVRSAHHFRAYFERPHDGILKILMEQGMRIQSNSNLNILSKQSRKLLKQHGGVGAHRKALSAAKCEKLGSFAQNRVSRTRTISF